MSNELFWKKPLAELRADAVGWSGHFFRQVARDG
jgi:hypothetical protein